MKTFHVAVKEDGQLLGVVSEHELVPVQHHGATGFISKTIYDALAAQEVGLRNMLDILGVTLDTDKDEQP